MLAAPLMSQLELVRPGPLNVLVELGQTELGPEIGKMGVAAMVMTIWSLTAGHGPLGSFEVNVNVTVPAAISEALGV
jgi:hypothetical protein